MPDIKPCPCCKSECFVDVHPAELDATTTHTEPIECSVCPYRAPNLAAHNRVARAVELVRRMADSADHPSDTVHYIEARDIVGGRG